MWRCGGCIVRAGKGNRGVSDRQILRVLFSGDLLASAYQNPNGRELSCNLSGSSFAALAGRRS